MKHLAGMFLLGLSLLLGAVAAMNIYFVLATAGKSQFSAVAKPNLVMQGIFAAVALVFFVGGIMILNSPKKES